MLARDGARSSILFGGAWGRCCASLLMLLLAGAAAIASDSSLNEAQRQQIIRDFLAEHPWVHRALPRGKAGVRIEGDRITPTEEQMKSLVAQVGVVAKPGQQVRITAVHFLHNGIVFEINDGPQKRRSWRDRISIGSGSSPMINPTTGGVDNPDNVYNGAQGSSVTLLWKGDASEITTARVKELLEPVLDFKSLTAAEAFQKSLPPKLAEAIKNHHALVGMNKEMVRYAMGRPMLRERETQNGQEFEEWIYGTPPRDVEFIRFLGDRAVSIEEMEISGRKHVRTEDEVGDIVGVLDASARRQPQARANGDDEEPRNPPSLLRPGEVTQKPTGAARDPLPAPPPDLSSPDAGTGPPGSAAPGTSVPSQSPFPH